MAIIPAKDLDGIDNKDILECFCNQIMENILEANKQGKKHIAFILPEAVYGNPETKEVSKKWEKKWPWCPYHQEDYREEVAQMFRDAGYRVYQPKVYVYEVIAW